MRWIPTHTDLVFLLDTLLPDRDDYDEVAELIQEDEQLLDRMLDDQRLFQRLMSDEELLIRVSPWLLFTVLLRQARRDLAQERYTVERRHRQRIVLFDIDQVVELLEQESLRDYLAAMLASFTRIRGMTLRRRVGKGVWRKVRTSELDVASLMRACEKLDEERRFQPYRRIADVCLFLTGLFPEFIEAQYRYPLSRQLRPPRKGWTRASLEEYEAQGQEYYRRAAEHQMARQEGLDHILAALAEKFILAEKSLTYMADRYLQFARRTLFDV